jgi:ribosomal protein S18 acetylase RimI-like enzyme
MTMPDGFALHARTPGVDDYLRLRRIAGFSPRSVEAAEAGLPHTLIAAVVEKDGQAVGMGRVIGDGALFFQLVDIAVDPACQGLGLGKAIVASLIERLRQTVPAEAYVSLVADGAANRLYAQYGFRPTAPASIGMAMWLR